MNTVESIYLSKLEKFQTVARQGADKIGADSGVFSELLNAISEKLGSQQAEETGELTGSLSSQSYGANWGFGTSKWTDIEGAISAASKSTGLDEDLIRAVIRAESSFRTDAVSKAGAMGLMQLMPGTAKEMGVANPFDARQNVMGGTAYLKKLVNRFGDIRLALAAYNTGPGRISSLGITDANDPEQYQRISSGVRSYVDRVLGYWQDYRNA